MERHSINANSFAQELHEASFFERHPRVGKALLGMLIGTVVFGGTRGCAAALDKLEEGSRKEREELAAQQALQRQKLEQALTELRGNDALSSLDGFIAYRNEKAANEIHLTSIKDLVLGNISIRKFQLDGTPSNILSINDKEIVFSARSPSPIKFQLGDRDFEITSEVIQKLDVTNGSVVTLIDPYAQEACESFRQLFGDVADRDAKTVEQEKAETTGWNARHIRDDIYNGQAAAFKISDLGYDSQTGAVYFMTGGIWYQIKSELGVNGCVRPVLVPETLVSASDHSADGKFSINAGALRYDNKDLRINLPESFEELTFSAPALK